MNGDVTEAVISRRPIVVRRRVRWGECDPAGVVYTPRFADYAVSALEHFIANLLGDRPQARMAAMGLGLPMKAMTFAFHRPLISEQDFEMAVAVAAIRTRTFDLHVDGRQPGGEALFSITMTPICVEPVSRTSVAIPQALLGLLEAYQRDLPPVGTV